MEKTILINEIINLGNECRVAAFKSQALRDPKIIQDEMKNFTDHPHFATRRSIRDISERKQAEAERERLMSDSEMVSIRVQWAISHQR